MRRRRGLLLSGQALLVVQSAAQFGGWAPNQVNTSICTWEQPRAALIRDTIYVDGGTIWWSPGFSTGEYQQVTDSGNFQGAILTYNLSIPFSAESNTTGILLDSPLSKARGGFGSGGSINFYDGGMLANNDEFFLYGGLPLRLDEVYDVPPANKVLEYEIRQYGLEKPAFLPGFREPTLDDGTTWYVAYGGAANAPSEQKAWYFSGLTSPTRGVIYKNGNESTRATEFSNTLITLDMSTQLKEKWTNKTLPHDVVCRANAEVVWVPVGKQGILVVLGGVIYPEWASPSHKSEDEAASKSQSPEFMSVIDIYDVAGDKWYKQPTKGAPGTRTRGCAVVAPASDYSSFNIYYYGGYNGLDIRESFSDEVWVLSLPSFTWTQISKGKSTHGRAGHKCFMPYPDQMMVVGGSRAKAGSSITCLDGGPVVMYNLTTGEWMDSYDPTKYGPYGVPKKVQSVIGGDGSGSATVTKPIPSGWATSALGEVFAVPYDTKKITKFWPYQPAAKGSQPPGSPQDRASGKKSGMPSWVAPVLGVVLGLVFITGCILLFFLWRRHRLLRKGSSQSGTEDAGLRILSWMRGHPDKAPTVATSDDTPTSPDMREVSAFGFSPTTPMSDAPHEMADTQLAELDDTSPRAELHDTGLSPMDIVRHRPGFLESPAQNAFTGEVNPNSATDNPSKIPNRTYSSGTPRKDSPSLGGVFPDLPFRRPVQAPPPVLEQDERSTSAMYRVSDTSTNLNDIHDYRRSVLAGRRTVSEDLSSVMMPISPRSMVESPTDDSASGRRIYRRSMFHENEADLRSP